MSAPLFTLGDDGRMVWRQDVSETKKTYLRHATTNFQLFPCERCGALFDYAYGDWWQCRGWGHWRRTISTVGYIQRATFKFARGGKP